MTEFCLYKCNTKGSIKIFIETLVGNKNVIKYIKDTWDKLCKTVLNEKVLLEFIDERSQYIEESALLNNLKWDNYVVEGTPKNQYGRKGENFPVSVGVVKEYVKNRFISLTNLINQAYSSLNK